MIDDGQYNVSQITKAVGITRQAYYKWRCRKKTIHEQQDEQILALIRKLERVHQHSVGFHKMARLVRLFDELDFKVSQKRIQRLMKANGIYADYRQPKRNRVREQKIYLNQNLLKRNFKQPSTNLVWVMDSTELTYGHGNRVRFSAALDLCGQYLVSGFISPTETAEASIEVLVQASKLANGLPKMIHTDRGAAHTSNAFNQFLAKNDIIHSYSAPGTLADNAVIEHWWADFKSIWIAHQIKANTLEELVNQVKLGIDYFNNKFISAKRNDLTATEYRDRKAIS